MYYLTLLCFTAVSAVTLLAVRERLRAGSPLWRSVLIVSAVIGIVGMVDFLQRGYDTAALIAIALTWVIVAYAGMYQFATGKFLDIPLPTWPRHVVQAAPMTPPEVQSPALPVPALVAQLALPCRKSMHERIHLCEPKVVRRAARLVRNKRLKRTVDHLVQSYEKGRQIRSVA